MRREFGARVAVPPVMPVTTVPPARRRRHAARELSPVQRARQSVFQLMQPMFERASRLGLWLVSPYTGQWYPPDILKQLMANGFNVSGPRHWRFMDPRKVPEGV